MIASRSLSRGLGALESQIVESVTQSSLSDEGTGDPRAALLIQQRDFQNSNLL